LMPPVASRKWTVAERSFVGAFGPRETRRYATESGY
jgi:hypothetical protein